MTFLNTSLNTRKEEEPGTPVFRKQSYVRHWIKARGSYTEMRIWKRAYRWSRFLPGVLVAVLTLAPGLHADQAADYWQKGEELYETHHLAPDRFAEALKWYEKAVALRERDYALLWRLSKRYQIYGQVLGKGRKNL